MQLKEMLSQNQTSKTLKNYTWTLYKKNYTVSLVKSCKKGAARQMTLKPKDESFLSFEHNNKEFFKAIPACNRYPCEDNMNFIVFAEAG